MVETFATIEPRHARLFGKKGEPIHATIRIVPSEKHAFQILGPAQRETNEFRYTLSKTDEPGTDSYLLTVENKQEKPGRYFGTIVLKTDSIARPNIKITVHGYVTE